MLPTSAAAGTFYVLWGAFLTASLSTFLFYESGEELVGPKYKTPKGLDSLFPRPWFYPKLGTKTSKILSSTIILPVLGGFIMPMFEACTHKSRWQKILQAEKLQLEARIPILCTFYKQQGAQLVRELNRLSSNPTGEYSINRKDTVGNCLKYIRAEAKFLKHFDSGVPEI